MPDGNEERITLDGGGPAGGGTVSGTLSNIKITHVFAEDGKDHPDRPVPDPGGVACAMVVGKFTVTATEDPEVALQASISGPPSMGDPFTPTNYSPTSSTDANDVWTFAFDTLPHSDFYSIKVSAVAPDRGAISAGLSAVANYTVDKCARPAAAAIAAAAGGAAAASGAVMAAVPDPYIEVLYAPTVVMAGQPFWVLVRAEPSSVLGAGQRGPVMYPLSAAYNPTVWTAGGSSAQLFGKTIFRQPTANPVVSLIEFTFPDWVREARLDFSGYSLPYSNIVASVTVAAIR